MKAAKFIVLAICLAVFFSSCNSGGNQSQPKGKLTAELVKQKVEKMMTIDPITPKDWPNVFTSKLIEIYNRRDGPDGIFGFPVERQGA